MGLTNCNTQIWISPTSGVYKPYNYFKVVTRCKVATRQKRLLIYDIFNLVATLALYETRLLQPKFPCGNIADGHGLSIKLEAICITTHGSIYYTVVLKAPCVVY